MIAFVSSWKRNMVDQDKMTWYEWSRMYQNSQEVADELHAEARQRQDDYGHWFKVRELNTHLCATP